MPNDEERRNHDRKRDADDGREDPIVNEIFDAINVASEWTNKH